jgi:hypothetical protein
VSGTREEGPRIICRAKSAEQNLPSKICRAKSAEQNLPSKICRAKSGASRLICRRLLRTEFLENFDNTIKASSLNFSVSAFS